MIDVYVSEKVRKYSNFKFGFVRFRREDEVARVIRRINNLLIKGNKIKVKKRYMKGCGEVKKGKELSLNKK